MMGRRLHTFGRLAGFWSITEFSDAQKNRTNRKYVVGKRQRISILVGRCCTMPPVWCAATVNGYTDEVAIMIPTLHRFWNDQAVFYFHVIKAGHFWKSFKANLSRRTDDWTVFHSNWRSQIWIPSVIGWPNASINWKTTNAWRQHYFQRLLVCSSSPRLVLRARQLRMGMQETGVKMWDLAAIPQHGKPQRNGCRLADWRNWEFIQVLRFLLNNLWRLVHIFSSVMTFSVVNRDIIILNSFLPFLSYSLLTFLKVVF